MNADLRESVVVVTGASRGIGRATAHAFAKAGARVALAARSGATLEQVRKEIEEYGREAIAIPTDVQDAAQVHDLVQTTLGKWGRIDVLVNDAGIAHHGPFVQMTPAEIQAVVATNLLGAMTCIREVLPHFYGRRQGHIVNIASVLGKRAVPNQAVYSATKFGLVGLSEALRCELAPYNISVTAVCPSSTSTEMNRRISQGDHGLKQFVRRVFMQTPETVAAAILESTRRSRREIILSLPGRAVVRMNQLFPGILDRLFTRLEKR